MKSVRSETVSLGHTSHTLETPVALCTFVEMHFDHLKVAIVPLLQEISVLLPLQRGK